MSSRFSQFLWGCLLQMSIEYWCDMIGAKSIKIINTTYIKLKFCYWLSFIGHHSFWTSFVFPSSRANNMVSTLMSCLRNLTQKDNLNTVWELANDNLTEKLLSAITILWLLNLLSKTNYLQFIRTRVWFFQTVSSLKKIKQLFVVNSWIRSVTY